MEEIDIDDLPMEEDLPREDYDDLNEYSFSKFASMYFQGAASHTHIRQRLQQPLLYHEDEEDVLVLVLDLVTSRLRATITFIPRLVFLPGVADSVVDYTEVHGRPS